MIIDDAEPPPPISGETNSASSSIANSEPSAPSASGVGSTSSASAGVRGKGAVVFSPRKVSQIMRKIKDKIDRTDKYEYCSASNVGRQVNFHCNPPLRPSITSFDTSSSSSLLDVGSVATSNVPRRAVDFSPSVSSSYTSSSSSFSDDDSNVEYSPDERSPIRSTPVNPHRGLECARGFPSTTFSTSSSSSISEDRFDEYSLDDGLLSVRSTTFNPDGGLTEGRAGEFPPMNFDEILAAIDPFGRIKIPGDEEQEEQPEIVRRLPKTNIQQTTSNSTLNESDPLLAFLQSQALCVRGSVDEFYIWLVKSQYIDSMADLKDAVSNDEYLENSLKIGCGSAGLKVFKLRAFQRAVWNYRE